MTKNRWTKLMDGKAVLTDAELQQGWHFCPEYDGLLIGKEMMEWGDGDECLCGFEVSDEPN